jgi:UDP-N-acetylglucosamine 2-epimerase (non-hydrolysing)
MAPRSRTKAKARSSRLPDRIRLLAIAGTRPEVLKLGPVVRALSREASRFSPRLCFSGQHPRMAREIGREVGMTPDFDLPGDDRPLSLSESVARLLSRLDGVFAEAEPEGVLVQGDTNTAFAGALVAFHHGVPVFHVEAGLRTTNPAVPFPEEMNRRLIARLATLHFAPTEHARENLLREGVPESTVVVTGNTVVDALAAFAPAEGDRPPPGSAGDRRMLLVTLHRRENASTAPFVAEAARALAARGDIDVVWIAHPNATSAAAMSVLGVDGPVRVLPPQPYGAFIGLLRRAHAVLTDSGGVQEEAPMLGVPAVVLRAETDRPESVEVGSAVVVGATRDAVVRACTELLDDEIAYAARSEPRQPFGDGRAAERIVAALERHYFP